MHITSVPNKRIPPPESVTITMTGEEALLLKRLLSHVGGPSLNHQLYLSAFRTTDDAYAIKTVSGALLAALNSI